MSDTPRTDEWDRLWDNEAVATWADFARQLERELNAANARIAELDREVRALNAQIEGYEILTKILDANH